MSRNSQRKAGAPKGFGCADKIEHHWHHTDPLRCACGAAAEATVYTDMLNGGVRISLGVCSQHMPGDDSAALDMLDAVLNAIATAVNEAGRSS